MKQDQFITIKRKKKRNLWNSFQRGFERTQGRGIETQMIPWVEDKNN